MQFGIFTIGAPTTGRTPTDRERLRTTVEASASGPREEIPVPAAEERTGTQAEDQHTLGGLQ